MPFTAADYQGMAQQRRRRRNPRAEVAQAASQARNQSSRQTPAGSDSMRLDRARPGVPALPVRGVSDTSPQVRTAAPPRVRTAAELAGGVAVGGVPAGTTPTGGGSPIETDGGAPEGIEQQVGMVPRGMLSHQRLGAGVGMPAGGIGVDPGDIFQGALGDYSDLMDGPGSPQIDKMTQEEAAMEQARELYAGFGQEAGADPFREGAGIGRVPGRAAGYGETLPHHADPTKDLQDEFDELMADLEAEREETRAAVQRDLSASQRRQAEINALAGRSIGGGFGGAVATTAVMGAAAIEEADRAIREKMTNAQAAWLDKKMQAVEAEKERAAREKLLRAQQTHTLEVATIETTPGEGGAGGDYAATTVGGRTEGGSGTLGSDTGPGADGAEVSGESDMSKREMWEEGWRREAGTGAWVNEEGEYWDDVNPDEASPYGDATLFSADPEYPVTAEGGDDDWDWGPELEESDIWFQKWWDGEITLNELQRRSNNNIDFQYHFLAKESVQEEMIEQMFEYDATYSGYGTDIHSNQISDIITMLGDSFGWTEEMAESKWGIEEGGDWGWDSGSLQTGSHAQDMAWIALNHPGLVQEIISYSLSRKSAAPGGSMDFGPNYIEDLREHILQSGFISPGINE